MKISNYTELTIKSILIFVQALMTMACQEKKLISHEQVASDSRANIPQSLLHESNIEFYKRKRSCPDFENETIIVTAEQAEKVFKKYYDAMLNNMTISDKGLSKVEKEHQGYYYSEIIGESWYIFVKHGDKFVFDGGLSVR